MASQAQITANQANAQHSTGPRTDQGKARVAQNHTTHGLAGRHVVLPGEDPEAFQELLQTLHHQLAPNSAAEAALVDAIAHAQWRVLRIAEWEAQLITESLEGDPANPSRLMKMFASTADPAEALARISRYEAATRRTWKNALKDLRTLQLDRVANHPPRNDPFTAQRFAALLHRQQRFSSSNPIPAENRAPAGDNQAKVDSGG